MPSFRRIRHQLAKTRLRSPLTWLRHRSFDPADVFIGSYPRSGSTWLRFVLLEILTGRPSEFPSVNRSIPKVGRHNQALPLLPGGGRLIQTHEPYREEYQKAVYLVRDPRDVVLSEFAYQKALGLLGVEFNEFVGSFLLGKANAYGSWRDHVDGWLDTAVTRKAHILLIRFEDMRQDTASAVASALEFLGVTADKRKIENAITSNSLTNMRAKEDRAPQIGAGARGEDRFVRSGAVGGWRSKLTPAQLELIEGHAESTLLRLGYASAGSRCHTDNQAWIPSKLCLH